MVFWWALITPGLSTKSTCSNFQLCKLHLLWPISLFFFTWYYCCQKSVGKICSYWGCISPPFLVGDLNTDRNLVRDGEASACAGFLVKIWSCNIFTSSETLLYVIKVVGASMFCWIRPRTPEPWRFALQSCFFIILVTSMVDGNNQPFIDL